MSGHLGSQVSPLVDGRLDPDRSARALAHLASCGQCRAALEQERATKARLAALGPAQPPADLTTRLLALAAERDAGQLDRSDGPRAAVAPPPGRPVARTSPSGRPRAARRPAGRRRVVRTRTAAAGASFVLLTLVGAFVSGAPSVGRGVVAPVSTLTLEHAAVTDPLGGLGSVDPTIDDASFVGATGSGATRRR